MRTPTPRTRSAAPRVLRLPGPDGPWHDVLAEFSRGGVAVVHATHTQWRDHLPTGAAQRELIGADLPRFESLANDGLRTRFLASRVLVKHLAAGVLRARPEDVELGYGMHGRMYLRGFDQVDISISHTRDVLLAGVSSRGGIGVDVEPADRALIGRDAETVMCSPHERATLPLDPADRNARLLRLWTLKEAYSKALGQGLLFPFTQFGFDITEAGGELLRADGAPVPDSGWQFWSVGVEGYLAAIAVQTGAHTVRSDTRVATTLNAGMFDVIQDALRTR